MKYLLTIFLLFGSIGLWAQTCELVIIEASAEDAMNPINPDSLCIGVQYIALVTLSGFNCTGAVGISGSSSLNGSVTFQDTATVDGLTGIQFTPGGGFNNESISIEGIVVGAQPCSEDFDCALDIQASAGLNAEPTIEIDTINCDTFQLTAMTDPLNVSGMWTASGASANISSPNTASTLVTGIPDGQTATLTFTATGACNPLPASVELTPTTGDIADAGASPTTVCDGSVTVNADNTIGTWSWDEDAFPLLDVSSTTDPEATFTGLLPGDDILLTWTVDGECGISTSNISIKRFAIPVADAGMDTSACAIDNINLSANAPSDTNGETGLWTVVQPAPAGINFMPDNSPNTVVTGIPEGTSFNVRWTVTNPICMLTAFDELTITSSPNPEAAISIQNGNIDETFCFGESLNLMTPTVTGASYSWSTGQTGSTISTIIGPDGLNLMQTFKVTVSNNGCEGVDSVTLRYYNDFSAAANPLAGSIFCAGGTGEVTFSPIINGPLIGDTLSYIFDDGLSFTTATDTTLSFSLPATSDLILVLNSLVNIESGCAATQNPTFTLTPDVLPSPVISTPLEDPCEGSIVTLTATDVMAGSTGTNYIWTIDGSLGSSTNSQQIMVANEVAVSVVATNDNGCVTGLDTIFIGTPPPNPSISMASAFVCPGQTGTVYTLNTLPANTDSVAWMVEGGNIVADTLGSITVNWDQSGPYSISVIQERTANIEADNCFGQDTIFLELEMNTAPEPTDILLFSDENDQNYFLVADQTQDNYQWYSNGVALAGETFRSLFLPAATSLADVENGEYQLETWNGDNPETCTTISSFRNAPPEVITPPVAETSLRIFPNPAKTELFFFAETSPDYEDFEIALFNLTGKLLAQRSVTALNNIISSELDVSKLPPGYYVVQLHNLRSGAVINAPLVIQR